MATKDFPVEAGHVMMFARAIGDPNPAYYPDGDVGQVLAPPTFVAAAAQFDPDYPLRPRPGEPWMGSGRTPSGTAALAAEPATSDGAAAAPGGTTMHAEQHYTYHRPLRADDVLHAESRPGEEWTKAGKRGGTLRFSAFVLDYRDAAGELVVTSRTVAVTTEHVPGGQA